MNKNINENIGDPVNTPVDTAKPRIRATTECIVCNEPVELSEIEVSRLRHGLHINSKICDKCKQAILYIRNEIKERKDLNKNDKTEI